MRIIAGKYGGRKLAAFKASHIRPTTDRVKEVLFNKLQFDIEEAQVLDLFSGTGNLAIESLSRGALKVVAVEKNAKSTAIIKKNIDLLKIEKEELIIRQQDVFSFLKTNDINFDIILVDPPFTQSLGDSVMEALSRSKAYHQDTQVFIETSKQEKLEKSYGALTLKEQKNYGDKFLSLFVPCQN